MNGVSCLKVSLLLLLALLTGCSWFHARKPLAPGPPELIVTGAPAGSILFIDGVQTRPANEAGNRPQLLEVAPGPHTLEVKTGDKVTYRENLDVDVGEKRVITVLSGTGR